MPHQVGHARDVVAQAFAHLEPYRLARAHRFRARCPQHVVRQYQHAEGTDCHRSFAAAPRGSGDGPRGSSGGATVPSVAASHGGGITAHTGCDNDDDDDAHVLSWGLNPLRFSPPSMNSLLVQRRRTEKDTSRSCRGNNHNTTFAKTTRKAEATTEQEAFLLLFSSQSYPLRSPLSVSLPQAPVRERGASSGSPAMVGARYKYTVPLSKAPLCNTTTHTV